MASNDEDLCTSFPDFAVICSFIEQFGEKLGLTLPNIGELQNFFEDTDNVNPLLSQGVCLLLRRINKSVKFDRWERGLQRFAHTYSHQDGWELERFGFKKAKLEVKIRVFKNLLEKQFDKYKSFKDKVNLLGASELRLQPCGRDKKGVSYWCQLDDCANLRIYSDDQDEETWTLVASTREELVALIAELESESPPGVSREISVDGSRSGTVTPMGLSEAPTPVDSKAATPVASGRTSPVIDTGQVKQDPTKHEEKKIKPEVVVEQVKERLKVEEAEELQNDGDKLVEIALPKEDSKEQIKENNDQIKENKEQVSGVPVKPGENLKDIKPVEEEPVTKTEAVILGETKEIDLKNTSSNDEQKAKESKLLKEADSKPEEKPLPINKDTVMRERDKKLFEASEKSEVKKKETVWDKLSKQKEEERAMNEKLLEAKTNVAICKSSKSPVVSQRATVIGMVGSSDPSSKVSDVEKLETKVSDVNQSPKVQENIHQPKVQSTKENTVAKSGAISPLSKSDLEKSLKSSLPLSVSMTPLQDKVSTPTGSQEVSRNLTPSTTITSASKPVPLLSTGRASHTASESGQVPQLSKADAPPTPNSLPLSPSKPGPLSSKPGPPSLKPGPLPSKAAPITPTSKAGPLSPASKAGTLSSTSKGGPPSPTSKASTVSPTSKAGPLSPMTKAGPLSPTSKGGPPSQASKSEPLPTVSVTKPQIDSALSSKSDSSSITPSSKSGSFAPTPGPDGKSVVRSPTSVPHNKDVTQGKDGPLSSSSGMSSSSGLLPSKGVTPSKGVPLSPTTGKGEQVPSQLKNTEDKVQSSVSSMGKLQPSSKGENVSRDAHTDPPLSSKATAVSMASTKGLTLSPAVSTPGEKRTIPKPSSKEAVKPGIPSSLSSNDSASSSVSSSPTKKMSDSPTSSAVNLQKQAVNDKTPEDSISPFPLVPTKGTRPSTPKDVAPLTSVMSLKRVPPVTPASTPEAIPTSNAKAPPLDSIPYPIPTETSPAPFPPAPGAFPLVGELTASDVPKAPLVSASKVKSGKYFEPPTKLAPISSCISTPSNEKGSACKGPPFDKDPALQTDSKTAVAPFPEVLGAKSSVTVTKKDEKDAVPASGRILLKKPLTPSNLPSKLTTGAAAVEKTSTPSTPSKSTTSAAKPNPSTLTSSPSKAPSKETNPIEPPQKKARVETTKSESFTESPMATPESSGRKLNLLKRSHVTSLGEKKDGTPHEAKVMKKEGPVETAVSAPKPQKSGDSPTKVSLLNKNSPVSRTEGLSTKTDFDSKIKVSNEKIEAKPSPEVQKPTGEPTRRLLKLHNFSNRDSAKKPLVTGPIVKNDETDEKSTTEQKAVSSTEKLKDEKPSSDKKDTKMGATGSNVSEKVPDVGDAIEEPLMIVKGDGEGAKCESGNDLYYVNQGKGGLFSSKPWWECFDSVSDSCNVVKYGDTSETIEEHVMYFWGEGNGADCDAGNNGDETDTNAETKQGDSGSSTLVASDNRGNSTSGEVKPQKEKESERTDTDIKDVDGSVDSDEAKVNGLRTLESEKPLNQLDKTEVKGEGKHTGVNGKKSKEDNDVDSEKSNVNTNSDLGEGKSKKDTQSLDNDNCENDVNNKAVSDDGEEESRVQKSNPSRGSRRKDKGNVELDQSDKLVGPSKEKDKGKGICAKRGTRNRASLEEIKDVTEESENDEDDEGEDDDKEEKTTKKESVATKKRRGRPKGSTRGRRPCRGTRSGSQRGSEPEEEDDEDENENENEDEDDEDAEDEDDGDNQGSNRKRRQRGRGSNARPLPDVPRQRSARIAKIREKEEGDRRELEALRMKQLAEENRLRELKRKAREERRSLREIKKGKREKKEKKDKDKKKKKRKKRAKKKTTASGDPWDHSSSSSSSSSEEEEIEEEEEENLEFKSDHEFSPESDIEDADAQPIKRARTAKKVIPKSEVEEEEEAEEEEEDQTQCTKCGHDDHPETILLCDNCDAGWHLSCLRPPLLSVPEGDWICPTCEHVVLVKKLKELLENFDECQKRAHNEEVRRQRLAFVNVSLDNILPEGGKKKKKKRVREDGEEEDDDDESGSDSDSDDSDSESDDSSGSSSESSTESDAPLYTLRARSARTLKEQVEDFDEMINEAIRDEMEAAAGAGNAGRGKDIDNIIQANDEDVDEEPFKAEPKPSEEGEKEEEDEKKEEKPKEEVEDKENETLSKPSVEVSPAEEAKVEKKEEGEDKREREADDEEEDDVAPKRKKQKPAESGSEKEDGDYKDSEDEQNESESEDDDDEVKTVRKRSKPYNMYSKKRRRLTDLDAEDDDDASDEDFMNSSEEEDEESDESAASSSSMATEYDSDDSDVGGKKRRGSRNEILPLRRSARNRSSQPYDEDSDEDKYARRGKKKKKRRKSSSEDEDSSDSDNSYKRKKKVQRRRSSTKSRGRRGSSKKGRGKKQTKSKGKTKKTAQDGDKPAKPRIKYAKPPKSKDDQDEEVVTQKRVTRGRQVNYCDALLMTDESEDTEPEKKWRGKVMKGERVPTESSEYDEDSDDEMKKRRGIPSGVGRGKVMEGEEEDEEEERSGSKKKRGRPKKDDDELIGKPESPPPRVVPPRPSPPRASPPRPSTIKVTPVVQVSAASPASKVLMQTAKPPPKQATSIIPILSRIKQGGTSISATHHTSSPQVRAHAPPLRANAPPLRANAPPLRANAPPLRANAPPLRANAPPFRANAPPLRANAPLLRANAPPLRANAPPASAQSAATYLPGAASPIHRGPESAVSPSPNVPMPQTKLPSSLSVSASNLGSNSPGHQQPMGKWSPHLPGVTITNISVSNAPGTPPRPNMGSAPGSGTPPRPSLTGPAVTASPPPPYRSSPLPPMSTVGRGATPPTSTAASGMPPVGPPNTSSPHSPAYPPYRGPPEHYSPHPGKERFPSHPAFPDYAPPGRHSPIPRSVPLNHPSRIPSGHSLPHMPGYGPPPGPPGSYPPGTVPPPHQGVLRGPPHDLYRPPHSTHPGHGSPSHPGHPHLVMKPGYPGLEPLPYAGSPGPSPGPVGIHPGSQDSPAQQSPNEDSKEGTLPVSKGPGEFSSGLMSYFSSQRDDDVE